ncbi:hypothetical protein V2J23_12495 [Geobacillus thermoleovorans]|uniref:hypothetical protein n=1 Tax=Geobacillus thermoleovorans TaxID=33941 RepID=UPI00345C39A1
MSFAFAESSRHGVAPAYSRYARRQTARVGQNANENGRLIVAAHSWLPSGRCR